MKRLSFLLIMILAMASDASSVLQAQSQSDEFRPFLNSLVFTAGSFFWARLLNNTMFLPEDSFIHNPNLFFVGLGLWACPVSQRCRLVVAGLYGLCTVTLLKKKYLTVSPVVEAPRVQEAIPVPPVEVAQEVRPERVQGPYSHVDCPICYTNVDDMTHEYKTRESGFACNQCKQMIACCKQELDSLFAEHKGRTVLYLRCPLCRANLYGNNFKGSLKKIDLQDGAIMEESNDFKFQVNRDANRAYVSITVL